MKYLLHGIVRGIPEAQPHHQGLCYVGTGGLTAAFVQITDAVLPPPDVENLLEFQRKIEFLHATTDVIPMRYGCYLEGEAEIIRHLQTRREDYLEMLEGLHGMSEMGVRLLLPPPPSPPMPAPSTPGVEYFAQARQRQGCLGLTPDEVRTADGIAGGIAGLWSRRHAEAASALGGRLLSLYFLVPKLRLSEFPAAVTATCLPLAVRFLITGPWPPYNFVGTWASNTEFTLWSANHSSTRPLDSLSVND